MLGSRFALQERMPGIYVNAAVSRQWSMAPSVATALANAGYLRPVVVIHLGTNGAVTNGAAHPARGVDDGQDRGTGRIGETPTTIGAPGSSESS